MEKHCHDLAQFLITKTSTDAPRLAKCGPTRLTLLARVSRSRASVCQTLVLHGCNGLVCRACHGRLRSSETVSYGPLMLGTVSCFLFDRVVVPTGAAEDAPRKGILDPEYQASMPSGAKRLLLTDTECIR